MFLIRTAEVKDNLLINRLASQVWGATYGSILTPEQLQFMFDAMYAPESITKQMTELGHRYFIVYADNEPCAYFSLEQKDPDTYIFQKIYALPQTQGTGVGRYMIEQGIAYLKGFLPTPFKVMLYVNRENPAVGFYKHLGFHIADTRDHHIGNGYYMNDYIMEMEVTSE
ncbi:GNAT family N-acetyltransferase [Parabacteroides sp. OttesenSCG-928-O15]|nr:GNAT family N-acetyltransferase [Parabacteroides sp. OttesenSCG-928-O15]